MPEAEETPYCLGPKTMTRLVFRPLLVPRSCQRAPLPPVFSCFQSDLEKGFEAVQRRLQDLSHPRPVEHAVDVGDEPGHAALEDGVPFGALDADVLDADGERPVAREDYGRQTESLSALQGALHDG
ncbi:hypothetical protein [Streptomyces sp. NPDC046832]|uniref:hypothetical protein n=1 Tax=Streptomyces sp. NPDC046832 TaxID=3155020 RepID=UPI0033DC1B6C